jgi:predicted dehydrogenase
MKTSLVVGMGIGNLYNTVLNHLGHGVVTVDSDPSKGADFLSVDAAIVVCRMFDTVHICTPNFTHFEIASKLAPISKIVFIEKPGVADSFSWKKLVETFPKTRFMMVKNNMWRSNIADLKELATTASTVKIEWTRFDCIPSPGSWFTTRKLAFGGVSRDLMPHLLSLYIALNPNWRDEHLSSQISKQTWKLKDIDSTEYGVINPNGTYDVDDFCNFKFENKWECLAEWRSLKYELSAILFTMQDNSKKVVELGWCPNNAYQSMIKEAIDNIDNYKFWLDQFEIDTWIHERIEKL